MKVSVTPVATKPMTRSFVTVVVRETVGPVELPVAVAVLPSNGDAVLTPSTPNVTIV